MEEKKVVQFLKELEKRGSTNEKKTIKKTMNIIDKEYNEIEKHCEESGYLKPHPNANGKIISTQGRNYILNYEEKEERNKREDKILNIQEETANINKKSINIQSRTLIILLITAVAAIFSTSAAIYSAYQSGINADAARDSANYAYMTYNLTLDSMVPNYADIEISSLDGGRTLSAHGLADNQTHSEHFQVCVRNKGRTDSGTVQLDWVNDEGYLNTPACGVDFETIPAGETRCDSLCIRNSIGDETKVPIGNTSLKLKLRCVRCNKQYEYIEYRTINMCIHGYDFFDGCEGW